MLKQMPPSDAPVRGHLVPMVVDGDVEQHPGDQAQATADEKIDELIINRDTVPLLEKNIKRIEETFKVVVGLGLIAKEEVEKQWVEIQGRDEDRASAKNYVKALCSPGETFPLTYPDEIHGVLTTPHIHTRIEVQSNAVLLFPATGRAIIQGEDNLAVTLAMSLIEDIMRNYLDNTDSVPSSPTSPAAPGSKRLDTELRRLSSQNRELYNEEFDMEELTSLPPAVKRTMLKHYMYDPDPCKSSADNNPDIDKDQTVPMRLINRDAVAGLSQPAFVDLHPERMDKTATRRSNTSKDVDMHAQKVDSDSLSLTLHLGTTESIAERKRPPMIDLNRVKSVDVIDLTESPVIADNGKTLPPSSTKENSSKGVISEAHEYALSRGYSEKEIADVQKDFGDLLSTSDFLKALVTNRRLEAEKHALSVSDLEASQIGRKKAGLEGGKDAEARSVLVTADRISPVRLAGQASGWVAPNDVSPEGTSMAGKQPNEIQAHNQGPKSKKGKHIKGKQGKVENKNESKKKERSTRWSAGEGGSSDDKTSPVRHPFEEILQSSPHVRGKKGEDKKDGKAVPPEVLDYLNCLTRDYDEEDSQDIAELRKRNALRQSILRPLLRGDKAEDAKEGEEHEEVEESEMDTDWVVAGRNGRQVFTSPQAGDDMRIVVENNNNKPKDKPSATRKNGNVSEPPKEGAGFFKKSTAAPKPMIAESAAVPTVDALDDFSLPYLANEPLPKGNHVRPLFPPSQLPDKNRGIQPLNYNMGPPGASYQPPALLDWQNSQHQQQQQQQYNPPVAGPSAGRLHSNLRYIVIDGSNVAMNHGNHKVFSCKGIRICIDYFKRRGHKEITAFVPLWRTHAPRGDQVIRDQHMLEEMRKEGTVVFTPSRKVPGKRIVCYDDKFVLRLAQETDGIMVSNDNYRDLWHEKTEWRRLIEKRLLMFSFVGDIFMPPDDPLGRNGPNLDDFLRKSNSLEQYPGHDFSRPPPIQNPPYPGASGWGMLGQRPQNQGQYFQKQPNTNFHQGPRPRNPAPFNPRIQGYHGGHNHAPVAQAKVREASTTQWLRKKVYAIFPDDEQKIDQVLERYPCETNVNEIINYMFE